MIHRIYGSSIDLLWAIALIGLPMTSMPLIWTLLGAIVAPASAIPVAILLIIWLLPHILRRGALPIEVQPALVFLVVIVFTSAVSFLLVEHPSYREKNVIAEMMGAFISLGLGSAFFFIFSSLSAQGDHMRKTMRWIHVGGIILLLWTSWQVYYVAVRPEDFPQFLLRLQEILVTHSPFTFLEGSNRVSGLAYEATWFAHQLNILYFPLWIAATYVGYSAFNWRVWRLSVENLLLVFGIVLFYFSSPRVGMIAFMLMAVFIFVKINLRLYRRLFERILTLQIFRTDAVRGIKPIINATTGLMSVLLLLTIYAGLIFLVLYFGSQRDWRLELLISNPPNWGEIGGLLRLDEKVVLWLGYRFAFLERTVYWVTGWRIFNQFPFFGVGLGNAGFYFPQEVPSIGWASFEIRNILLRLQFLPNIKSLWVRLLAESGILGFSAFLVWVSVLWRSTFLTMRSHRSELRTIALAGQLSLVALIAEGFSIDSFAMPYLWVMAGLIAAAGMVYRQQVKQQIGAPPEIQPEVGMEGMLDPAEPASV
jgi:hypothetical protein